MAVNLDHDDVAKAAERIKPYLHQTPVLSSSLLNSWLGHEIFFKCENFQKIGAFKARGAFNTVLTLLENGAKPKRLVANSSGNHAQAVALAGKELGIPVTIFMPAYSSKAKISGAKAYGAQVELTPDRNTANERVEEASKVPGNYWLHPYNNEGVIAGQGTAAMEAYQEIGQVHATFTPCGGGGLLSGTYLAASKNNNSQYFFGVEPAVANDAARSLKSGKIERLTSKPNTLADGAMTLAVGDITFEYLKKTDGILEAQEIELPYWTQWLSHLLKSRIEPTSALAMAGAHQWLKKQEKGQRVLIILSGGNMDQGTTQKVWAKNYLDLPPAMDLNW